VEREIGLKIRCKTRELWLPYRFPCNVCSFSQRRAASALLQPKHSADFGLKSIMLIKQIASCAIQLPFLIRNFVYLICCDQFALLCFALQVGEAPNKQNQLCFLCQICLIMEIGDVFLIVRVYVSTNNPLSRYALRMIFAWNWRGSWKDWFEIVLIIGEMSSFPFYCVHYFKLTREPIWKIYSLSSLLCSYQSAKKT
jgi:hypothetical protein